jgi:hypothetical protein
MKKTLLYLSAIALMVGVGIAYYLFNKPQRTANDEKPFAILTTDQLYQEFVENDTMAYKKYQGKVLQVSGVIGKTDVDASGYRVVNLITENGDVNVVITLMKDAVVSSHVGDSLTVKGICNGSTIETMLEMLMGDIQLNQGVVVNK